MMSKLRAKTAFMVSPRRFIGAGDLVDDKDPAVKGREHLFSKIDDDPKVSNVSRSSATKPSTKKKDD